MAAVNLNVPRNQILKLASEVLVKERKTLAFVGPPGTGKSTLADDIASAIEPCACGEHHSYWFPCTPSAMSSEIIGGTSPDGETGRWHWHPGPYALAAGYTGHPGVLVIDDVHLAGDDLEAALQTVLNKDTSRVTLPNGETFRPHAQYWPIVTSNETVDNLPAWIRDRIASSVMVMSLSDGMLDALRPEVRALAAADYDGTWAALNPIATYRQWQSLSRNWTLLSDAKWERPLSTAAMLAMGDQNAACAMLEIMSANGIADAVAEHSLIASARK